VTKFKNGDYYRWSYKEMPYPTDWTLSYWCKSRLAVVVDGSLYDTYWHDTAGRAWVDPDRVELEFIGNVHEFVESKYGEYLYYDRADILDTRHANDTNGKIYIRKGAERSREVMLEYAREKLERADSALRSAMYDLERWNLKVAEIEAAEDLKEVWL
jgi:hypothetical protein